MTEADAQAVETMNYETALAALEAVVTRLERGEAPLEESITLYERGAALKKRCEALLDAAQLKVAQITEGPDGSVEAKPFGEG